jgi:hypothetical protein
MRNASTPILSFPFVVNPLLNAHEPARFVVLHPLDRRRRCSAECVTPALPDALELLFQCSLLRGTPFFLGDAGVLGVTQIAPPASSETGSAACKTKALDFLNGFHAFRMQPST